MRPPVPSAVVARADGLVLALVRHRQFVPRVLYGDAVADAFDESADHLMIVTDAA